MWEERHAMRPFEMGSAPKMAVLGVAAAAFCMVQAPPSHASTDIERLMARKVTLELTGVPGDEALRRLFKAAGVNWVTRGPIGGTVTLSFRNVPFRAALVRLLGSVERTYTIRDGVFDIQPIADWGIDPARAAGPVLAQLNYVSAEDGLRMLRATPGMRPEDGGTVWRDRGGASFSSPRRPSPN
jgi:hypothetical protein